MQFRQLDLNLLRVLVELDRTRSVTRAGQRLFLSQPATSHALARLRDWAGDPLFVRGAQGLEPTRLARRLAALAAEHLDALERAFAPAAPFDPATATETWRLSLSDLGELVFLPPLARAVRTGSPASRLVNAAATADQVDEALARGDVDLAIGILEPHRRDVRSTALFRDEHVALTSAAWKGRRLDAEALSRAGLIVADPAATYHRGTVLQLERLGLASRVALHVRHFGAMPDLIADDDGLVAIVPVDFAMRVAPRHGLEVLPLALGLPAYDVCMLWHLRTDIDPSRAWLREQVVSRLGRRSRLRTRSAAGGGPAEG